MTERRRPLIAANWKMNGSHETGAELAREVAHRARQAVRPAAIHHPHADILICPPAILVPMVREALTGSPVWLGGQDCHWAASGAYTGDISAPMLKDAGAGWVIVGHSERRSYHAETDAAVRAKAEAALAAGLNVIVCVGETEAERDSGHTLDVVARQIDGSLPSAASPSRIVVAYEPIWAIGTGRTPTLDEIATVHAHIRALVAAKLADGETVRVLYGGSVKPSNAAEVMALADVDGALVGGASLVATDFWAIVEAVPGRDEV